MARTRLNLEFLRRNGSLRTTGPSGHSLHDALDNADELRVSRRGMIGLAGLTIAGASPVLKGARVALSGGYDVSGNEKRLAFLMGGKERWVIEAARFAGNPHLTIERMGRSLKLSLEGARYPGTDIPADFTCEIRPGVADSRIRMTMAVGGFAATGSFEGWLLGVKRLTSHVRCGGTVCGLGSTGSLSLHGNGRAEFFADWSLKLEGKEIAGLFGLQGGTLISDRVAVALPSDGNESIFETSDSRRTVLTVHREERRWELEPEASAGRGWSVKAEPNTFDRITIETGESVRGKRSAGLLAETISNKGGEGRLLFVPQGSLTSPTGAPYTLPLQSPRYAIEFGARENGTALIADYPERGIPMRAGGLSLKLGTGAGPGFFELQGRGKQVASMDCAPAILSATIPLKGGIVRAATPRRETRLRFFPDPVPHVPGPGKTPTSALPPDVPVPDEEDGDVVLDDTKEAVVTFPLDSVVWVLRPADMLYLGFEFINLKFTTGGGVKPKKPTTYGQDQLAAAGARGTGDGPIFVQEQPIAVQIGQYDKQKISLTATGSVTTYKPYLVVHFPPQNIAEQAFWEAEDPDDGLDEEKPANMPSNPGGSEKEDLPPVQHRVAGPSRLAFKLPSGSTSLPYTLEDLLDWSVLEPSVVPAALPPPPPPSPAIGTILGLSSSLKGKIADQVSAGKRSIGSIVKRDVKEDVEIRSGGTGRTRYSNITLKRGYISSGTGTAASKSIIEQTELMAGNPSLRAEPGQLGVLSTDNAAAKFDLYLNLKALTPEIIKPKEYHTAIEAPYRLILSPHVYSGWAHSFTPVTHNGTTELWHTRLGVRRGSGAVDEHDDYYRTVRAVWSPDYAPDPDFGPASKNMPFRMSLNARDRHEMVHLSANFKYKKDTGYVPDSVQVNNLMLSSLGAWMNTRGAWEPPPGLSIEEWRHRGTMGRDHYVRVVYKGFMYPFGNRASLIKVTERKIRYFSKTGYMAYMYQRMYIVIRKPEMIYPALNQPYDGRRTPFRKVRLTTLVTPNLDQPDVGASKIAGYGDEAFWPRVASEDFQFNVIAEDWEGNQTEFSTPLAFVNNKWAFDYNAVDDVEATYDEGRAKRETEGQTIAYAPGDKPGDTSFETNYVVFTSDVPTSNPSGKSELDSLPKLSGKDDPEMYAADQPYFYPAFDRSKVRIDAVEQIAGSEAFREIGLHDTYYRYSIESSQNKGQVFAKLLDQVELSFNTNADKGGGIATPNLNVAGLSRSLGTVGGNVEEITSGKFDPTNYFDEALDANLIGGISLRDIIDTVNDFAGDLIKIPRMVNSKSFRNPKELLGSAQSLLAAVDDVKGDIEKFQEMKDDLEKAIDDIEALPDTIADEAKSKAEAARQKALAVIKEIENEAKGIVQGAKGYAESVLNKVNDIAESESLVDLLEAFGLPTELVLELKWGPKVSSWPNPSNPFSFMGPNALFYVTPGKEEEVFVLRVSLTIRLDGSEPEFLLEGKAANFRLQLVPIEDVADEGFVHLKFENLRFFSQNAQKPEVDVVFEPSTGITFHGPLSFVEKIREFIPFDGFSDPPSLDVSPTGITAGFTFPIPSIAVGVFSLQNISLGATLELPFTNSPIVFTFLFCTRENPFVLTVSMFGGGGYFGLIVTTKEIGFEAALEFGGSFSFNIGIASGGVYVMAGVYFKKMGEECILEGYLKLGGSLEILGLITVSVEFYMSLTYQDPGGKVYGQAELKVKVEVLCFSKTVTLRVERRFKGSENDPLFIDLMAQHHWDEYCEAFA